MKIECTIKRDGGTQASIGGVDYHFVPNDDDEHVCDVDNKAHIKRFLSISEAYREHGVAKVPSPPEMDTNDLNQYAIDELGIADPTDKVELIAFAKEMLGMTLIKSMKPSKMIAEIMKSIKSNVQAAD